MARDSKFSPSELRVREQVPTLFGPPADVFTTPITSRENTLLLYRGKTPLWSPFAFGEHSMLMIDCDPENRARSPKGGVDGYGVEWVYVDVVGGAMVKPGRPKCPDIAEWEKYVTIPDPDQWDWEGCFVRNRERLSPDRCTYIAVPGCLFERLIAIMDFQNAAMALIDE